VDKKLFEIGIRDESFQLLTVGELVKLRIIERPLDGIHGEIHPKGDDFVESGVPFIMATDINDGAVDYVNCKFITSKQADNLRKGFAKQGDVLVTHKASIGRTAIVDYSAHPYIMLTPQVTYYRVIDKKKLNNRYLKYYFDSQLFQETLKLWAGAGATRAYLGITGQLKLPVILPPIEVQERVAAILSAYDDLIENNKRRIALLEKMAEEIYREWFVRFRFPGYQTAEFEKGIPKGWDEICLENFCEKVTDGTHDTPKPVDSGHYLVTGKNIKNSQITFDGAYLISENDHIAISKRSGLKEWDILFSNIGTVGETAIVSNSPKYSVKNIIIFRPKDFYQSLFLAHVLKSPVTVDQFLLMASGASQQFISLGVARGFKILDPGTELIRKFGDNVKPLWGQINNLQNQNQTLTKTKGMLLPRLISGKLTVADLDIQFPPSMLDDEAA
jgi:type I restriction enzyme S subunit